MLRIGLCVEDQYAYVCMCVRINIIGISICVEDQYMC